MRWQLSDLKKHIPLHRDPVCLGLAALTLLLHLFLLQTQSPPYEVFWVHLDEGYRLYPGLRLLRGQSLYSDMYTAYPPLSFHLHELAFRILGVKVSSVRIVLIVAQMATTLLTYTIARRLMNRWFSLFAALLTILFGIVRLNMGYAGWYVIPLTLAIVLFFFRYVESGFAKRQELLFAGVAAGLTIGMKLKEGAWAAIAAMTTILVLRIVRDFEPGRGKPSLFNPVYLSYLLLPLIVVLMLRGFITGLSATVFLIPNVVLCALILVRQTFFTKTIHPQTGGLLAEAATFLVGCAAAIVPWVLYHALTVGPQELWHGLVSLPMGLSGQIRDLPWQWNHLTIWAYGLFLSGLLWVVFVLFSPRRWESALPYTIAAGFAAISLGALSKPDFIDLKPWLVRPPAILILTLPFATSVSLLFLLKHWRCLDAMGYRIVILAVFSGVVSMYLDPVKDFYHWLWTCTLTFIIFSFAAARAWTYLQHKRSRLRPVVYLTPLILIYALLPPEFAFLKVYNAPRVLLEESTSGDVPLAPATAREIQPVLEFIKKRVPVDGFILEIPSSLFCFLSGRRQASTLDYYYWLNASLWDEAQEIRDIEANAPLYAIVHKAAYLYHLQPNFPRISHYLRSTYVPFWQSGSFQILKRRSNSD